MCDCEFEKFKDEVVLRKDVTLSTVQVTECAFEKYKDQVVMKKDLVNYVKMGFKMNWILVVTVVIMAMLELVIAGILVFR